MQYLHLTLMAMGRFLAEVLETGVDHYGLGQWCWMKVGSGDKKTQIVMAYQPPGSSSSNSASITVWEQHKQYFQARGDLRSAKAIFFELLIPQLVVWKTTDADIILLGDFNENVYTGQIAKCIVQADLNFSKQCLGCTSLHIPPTFRDGSMSINAVYATAGIECVNTRTFSLTKEGLETIDVLLSTSAHPQWSEQGFRILFNAPQGSCIVNQRG